MFDQAHNNLDVKDKTSDCANLMHSMVGGLQGNLTGLIRVPILSGKVKVVAFMKP